MTTGSRLARALACAGALAAVAAAAAPFVPASDETVLERLPVRRADPAARELRELRRRLAADPANLALATGLAERYYRRAVREGDPRYVGYAQAALAPWWQLADPPVTVLVLRAGLRQYVHDFEAALRDLDRALESDPDALDAWSYRAVIHLVMGNYARARHDCRELRARLASLVTETCEPTVDALTGRAAHAYARLGEALARHAGAPPNERLWALTRLAEAAQRLGRDAEAGAHFRQALALGIEDQYLLAAYAEFLLDAGRPQEVVDLLADKARNDVLLLRLALAEKVLGRPEAAGHQAAIQARMDAARLRGDKLHLSDEARFSLDFLGRPQEAVRLARENWDAGQHEPDDARILFEAALAARAPALAQPALDWLRASGVEDAKLAELAVRLRALKP